jgi:hypothetical protein
MASRNTSASPPARQRAEIPGQTQFFQISGACETEMSPDQAVILGGISSSALQPTDAVDQLEKQLGLMRSYVAEKHGKLELLERVRTLKNPQPGKEEADPPFQVVQRLQATFPADAPVDAILQKLIALGLDRFGDNILNNYGNRRDVVVRFRVSDLDAKLKDLQQQCTLIAWKQWISIPPGSGFVESQTPPSDLDLQSFTAHSREMLMRPDGGSAPWQFNFGRGQRVVQQPDLVGNVTIHLEGNIFLAYRREAEKP